MKTAVLPYESDLSTEITLGVDDGTCLCPVNGRRDRFTLSVTYAPTTSLLELSQLRQWVQGYAEARISHEQLTSEAAEWLIVLLHPAYLKVETVWLPVEGVYCTVRVVAGE